MVPKKQNSHKAKEKKKGEKKKQKRLTPFAK